jgi:Uncharacterized protein conserved in bacteria
MKQLISAFTVAIVLLVSSLASAHEYKVGALTIEHPWARASVSANGVAYMTITNSGTEADELVAVASPVAANAELHTHIMEGEVMKMRPVQAIKVAVGAPAVLEPGGLHIMLLGLKAPLKEGEKFPMTLTFKNAGTVSVDVAVEAAGASAPAPMGEHKH